MEILARSNSPLSFEERLYLLVAFLCRASHVERLILVDHRHHRLDAVIVGLLSAAKILEFDFSKGFEGVSCSASSTATAIGNARDGSCRSVVVEPATELVSFREIGVDLLNYASIMCCFCEKVTC